MTEDLVVQRPEGLYCPAGDFFIDPWRRVDRAVVTHAHADHARTGHGRYLCAAPGAGVLRARLGRIDLQAVAYGEAVDLDDVRVSLHPAGHILGSAQVRIEHRARGEVWVVAGDYFHSAHGELNPTCEPFEPVRCDVFVTEATFGAPLYRWPPHARVFADLVAWWRANADDGACSVVQAYSLGKTQHVLAMLGREGVDIGPLLAHPASHAINDAHVAEGVALPRLADWSLTEDARALRGALVVAPPQGAAAWRWHEGLVVRESFASGWMQQHGARHRAGLDRGFVLSDHADWPGLLAAIAATGCTRVIVTHGSEALLERACAERGLQTQRFRTAFGDEADVAADPG
jgi:putative mRNA 3-end processing factor